MTNLQSHYTSGPTMPAQHAALAAIQHPYSFELRDALQRARDLLHEEARAMPYVKLWPSPGAFYSFWDVRECFGKRAPDGAVLETSDDVAAYLIRAAGVVTLSGSAFLHDGYLRVSFAVADEEIVAGVRAAAAALGALK